MSLQVKELHKPCVEKTINNPDYKTEECKETTCIFYGLSQKESDKLNEDIRRERMQKQFEGFDNRELFMIHEALAGYVGPVGFRFSLVELQKRVKEELKRRKVPMGEEG